MARTPRRTSAVIGSGGTPTTPLAAVEWLQRRRWIDRIVAIVGATLTAPLVAVIAVLIRRHDGGPPLIRVPRTGEGGRTFGMWKLRSMRAESPTGMATGATLTNGTSDDRITPIGRRLRSFHLDELPQLWNVAAGEMSLLGPRPETPEFVDLNDPRWRTILTYPPGMAGPTQLIVSDWEREIIGASTDASGYRNAVLPTKLAIDLWYLTAASPATDLLVAGTLLRRFVPGSEAWTLRQRVFAEVAESAPARAFLQAHDLARRVARGDSATRRGLHTRLAERVAQKLDERVARRSLAPVRQDLTRTGHDWVWEARLDGGVVLYDAVHELAHLLSPEAASVWARCDGRASVQDIAVELATAEGIDPEQMLRDVTTVVLHLEAAGALIDASADTPRLQPPDPDGRRLYASDAPRSVTSATGGDRPGTDQGPVFHALGYRFRVVSTPVFTDQIAKALAPLAEDSTVGGEDLVVGYEVVRSDDRTQVHLFRAGVHLRTAPVNDAIDLLVWYVTQHAIAAADRVVLHAAAVEDAGRVVLIPGPTGAGKSLLSLALVASGYGYVAEDTVAVDAGTVGVQPFPQPFRLSEEALPIAASFTSDLSPTSAGASTFVDPDDVRPGSRSEGGVPTLVVAAAYRPGAALLVEPLSEAQTLVQLLSSAANLDVIGRAGFDALRSIAARVRGYRIEYGDANDACRAIDELAAIRTPSDER